MANLVPIVNAPNLYGNGCQITHASTTTLGVGVGQWRDSTNTFDIVLDAPLTVDNTFNGVNGLDTGTVADSTFYYVFLIMDPTNTNKTAALMSLSATAPVMPSLNGVTYGAFRLIGCALTDGSAHFLNFYASGDTKRLFQWDAPIVALNAGAATSVADVDLSVAVPSSNYAEVQLKSTYVPHAAADTASVKPKAATNYLFVMEGIVASAAQPNVFTILPTTNTNKPYVSYVLSSGTSPAALTLSVTGFYMNL